MPSSELRRFLTSAALAVIVAVAGATFPSAAVAQGMPDTGAARQTTDDGDEQNWGWIGLLGLAGLLGLRRREHVERVDTTRPRP